ncbi:MAG: O-antigen ligase family protein [Planctomycetota bacterium]
MLSAAALFLTGLTISAVSADVAAFVAAAVAVNGAFVTLFALAFASRAENALYWQFEGPRNSTIFGPFLYHNQAGGYLAIAAAGAMAWWSLSFGMRRPGKGFVGKTSVREEFRRVLARFDGPLSAATISAALIGIGILLTRSRGTWLSAVGAAVPLVIVLLLRRGRRRGGNNFGTAVATAAVAVCGVAGVLGLAKSEVFRLVSERVGDVSVESFAEDDRWSEWQVAIRAHSSVAPWGSGLGTYGSLSPLFQEEDLRLTWLYAHNQYLETGVEAGLPGITLLTVIMLSALAAGLTGLRRSGSIGAGMLCFLTIQTALHATVDYVAVTPSTLFAGALLAGTLWPRPIGSTAFAGPSARFAAAVVAVVLGLGMALSCQTLWQASRVERAVTSAPVDADVFALGLEDVASASAKVMGVDGWERSAFAASAVAELEAARYRLDAYGQLVGELESKGLQPGPADLETLKVWTDPKVLADRVRDLREKGEDAQIAAVLGRPVVKPLQTAFDAARLAAAHDGLAVAPRMTLATLAPLFAPEEERFWLEAARCRAGVDHSVLYLIGEQYFAGGNRDVAFSVWTRAAACGVEHLADILALVLKDIPTERVLDRLLPADPMKLASASLVVREYDPAVYPEAERFADAAIERAVRLVERTLPETAEEYAIRSKVYTAAGRHDLAIADMRIAIRRKDSLPVHRLVFVNTLLSAGMLGEAEAEAGRLVRLYPADRGFKKLLRKVVAAREAEQGRSE